MNSSRLTISAQSKSGCLAWSCFESPVFVDARITPLIFGCTFKNNQTCNQSRVIRVTVACFVCARWTLARVENADNSSMLETVRNALEESLGLRFDEKKGRRFFLSTFIQTLFYGLFSAWVLWAQASVKKDEKLRFSGGYRTDNFNW